MPRIPEYVFVDDAERQAGELFWPIHEAIVDRSEEDGKITFRLTHIHYPLKHQYTIRSDRVVRLGWVLHGEEWRGLYAFIYEGEAMDVISSALERLNNRGPICRPEIPMSENARRHLKECQNSVPPWDKE